MFPDILVGLMFLVFLALAVTKTYPSDEEPKQQVKQGENDA